MRTETVDIIEAQAGFRDLVRRVSAGLHVILSEDHKPVARILPAEGRVRGLHPGAIQPAEDFDQPLPDSFWTAGS